MRLDKLGRQLSKNDLAADASFGSCAMYFTSLKKI